MGAAGGEHRVAVSLVGNVAEVRLDRPDKHNALDFAMFNAISDAIDEVADDPAVRAVVLHGAGKSFCSGLDLAGFAASGVPIEEMFVRRDGEDANLAQRVSYGWQLVPAPVICAVHGNCIGGGAQIALGADIRVIAPDATVSIREVQYAVKDELHEEKTQLEKIYKTRTKQIDTVGEGGYWSPGNKQLGFRKGKMIVNVTFSLKENQSEIDTAQIARIIDARIPK